jgi:hypothetical protein
MSASFVVSFGEDACAHVYVASQAGPVYRIQPSTSQPACAPQGIPIEQRAASDSTGPHLSVNRRGGRRAARRGRVTLIVSCDEPCRLQGWGRIGMPGKDILLGSDSSGPAPAGGTLDLPLSATGARRLGASLDSGRRARAMVRIDATDAAGNRSVLRLKIRQRQ